MAEHTVRLFAHTNHEHALASTQIVAKLQRLFHIFSSRGALGSPGEPWGARGGKPSPPAPKFGDNLRRGGAWQTKICMKTW